MRFVILSNKIVSILLIAIDLIMMLLLIISKVTRGRVVQYAEAYPRNVGNESFYPVIYYGEMFMIILVSIWSILALTLVIYRKLYVTSNYTKLGVVGFILSIIYLHIDPFGLGDYYEN